jgi:hypothetical protein
MGNEMKKTAIGIFAMLILSAASVQADLVAVWHLDGNADDAINGYDGTVIGGGYFDTGMIGQALYLDGDGDYIDLGSTNLFEDWSAATVEFWARPEATSETWSCVFGKWSGYSFFEAPALGIHSPTGTWFWEVTKAPGGADTNVYQYGSVPVDYGEWQLIAYVFDFVLGEVELYKNGVLADSWSGDIGTSMAPGTNTVLGGVIRSYARHFFNGAIDEVRIWDEARPPIPCDMLGDPTCDQTICNLFDILASIDQALGIQSEACEADVDCSNAVDVFDVLCMIDCALGRPSCLDTPCTGGVLPPGCPLVLASQSDIPPENSVRAASR